MECCRGVTQPERHNFELKQALWSAEYNLLTIVWMHFNLSISTYEVQGGEPMCVKGVINPWERIGIFASNSIEVVVVDAKSQCPVLLFDKHNG